MANPRSTTPAPDERNSLRELVIGAENEITNLEGYACLLQLAADGVASHHGSDPGDGLIRLAAETGHCVERLREWYRKAHAAAVAGQDMPEPDKSAAKAPEPEPEPLPDDPEARWRHLYARWLTIRAEWAKEPVEEERTEELSREEAEIVIAMATMTTPLRFIEQKFQILEDTLFHDRTSDWSDRRDELLLNSIRADVKNVKNAC